MFRLTTISNDGCPILSAVRDDKRGANAEDLPPISERIGITRAAWLQLAKGFETTF